MLFQPRERQAAWIRLVVFACIAGLCALDLGNRFASSTTLQAFGSIIARVPTSERVVALTFDDGPRRDAVDTLLPWLAAEHAQATFFVEGRELERDLALGREIKAAGHELGNHSYSHARMLLKSQSFIAREIERTDEVVRKAGQVGPIQFRPPYGKKLFGLPWYLSQHHRPCIMWDVAPDAHASEGVSASRIAAEVLANTRPGSIILLHVMFASGRASLQAVPAILSGLRGDDYRVVSVSELLRYMQP